jgi:hypothetical protein
MAITRLNQIRQKWNQIEAEQKEAYKARKGLKIARGWKESPEFKDIEKRKKRAVYRYGYRKRQNYFKKKQGKKVVPKTPLKNQVIYANGDPHHLVLSYGSGAARDLIDDIGEQQKGGRSIIVGGYVNGGLIGTAATEQGVSRLFKILYERANEMQTKTGESIIPVFASGQFYPDENTWKTVVEIKGPGGMKGDSSEDYQ